jgi:hypothetical protein
MNLYDTKFLCEYHHYINKINLKCKIYDILFEMKIFNQEKLDNLNDIENKIGPIYNVKFNINDLNEYQIKYALYDVLFLPKLVNKFKDYSIIKNLTSICYYYKRVNNDINNLNIELNNLNNNIIIINNNKIKLIDIFYYFYYFKLVDHEIMNYINITYFKEFIIILIKYLIYNNILKYFKIKNEIKFNISNLFLYDKIKIILDSLNYIIKKDFI